MPLTTFVRRGPAASDARTAGSDPAPGAEDLLESLTATEWLLTNGQGGFAMGTASGIPTRRYHGLLVATPRPPVNRVMALSALAETVTIGGTAASGAGSGRLEGGVAIDLSNFRFAPDLVHPQGYRALERFEKSVGARWVYRVDHPSGSVRVVKTVCVVRNAPAVVVHYGVTNPTELAVTLTVRPLLALRDFHGLVLRDLSPGRFTVEHRGDSTISAAAQVGGAGHQLLISARAGDAGHDGPATGGVDLRNEQGWWYNFTYGVEASRGYDHLEDLYSPGAFVVACPAGGSALTVRAALNAPLPTATIDSLMSDSVQRRDRLVSAARVTLGPAFAPGGPHERHKINSDLPALVAAADDFVIRRVRPGAMAGAPADRVSIIAGYPWFADWGRDSMIALPGLLLSCGRFAEARAVLETFAAACKDGLIPNVFDDYTGQPHYNTVDAALWFVHACCAYLGESGDADTFGNALLPACLEVVDRYTRGTHFGIRVDPADGLVRAGDESTQLTWMDAKRDGVVFTPRHGKPVEISALWYNALRSLAVAVSSTRAGDSGVLHTAADRAGASLRERMWNTQRGCLFDVLGDDGVGSSELRPNQLFAVSLPHSALTPAQQRSVVEAVTGPLATPLGVRTLEPGDWRYRGRFRGRMFDRDAAYHNGTAWPWLMGPLAEATARAEGFSAESIARGQALLRPLINSMDAGCFGQIAEVYDGDGSDQEPRQAGACPAQAWSVAEVLRVSVLLARAEP